MPGFTEVAFITSVFLEGQALEKCRLGLRHERAQHGLVCPVLPEERCSHQLQCQEDCLRVWSTAGEGSFMVVLGPCHQFIHITVI